MIRNSGFAICEVLTDICTTVNMTFEQKENFFISTFGSRKSIARQIAARDGVETEELTHLISYIDRMENLFYNTDFWYSESNLLFVAQKQ
jgi:succinyl-CoA synthetase beta subunit